MVHFEYDNIVAVLIGNEQIVSGGVKIEIPWGFAQHGLLADKR